MRVICDVSGCWNRLNSAHTFRIGQGTIRPDCVPQPPPSADLYARPTSASLATCPFDFYQPSDIFLCTTRHERCHIDTVPSVA